MKRVQPPAELTLSADELRIIQCFRAIDDRWQANALVRLARHARDYPRHSKPTLRLISGGTA